MKDIIKSIVVWVREDYHSYPLRCVLEITAWVMSIMGSVIMMFTLPNPPFFFLYPLFIIQCGIFAWAAKTRKSLGMLANYTLLITIDSIALIRLTLITF